MNPPDTKLPASASDALDEFFSRYEQAADRVPLLEAYCRQHPELAQRVRGLAEQIERMRAATAVDSSAERLAAGQMLGPFCVLRELASGGMGVIYEARQIGLERRVALKTIRPERTTEIARQRFVREQQALALLHHTHIVPVFASGTEAGLHYYGMQFIDGITLHAFIERAASNPTAGSKPAPGALRTTMAVATPGPSLVPAKRFPSAYFRFAAETVAQAAEAVAFAHERGVIHRDLKPANLLLDAQGKCWLIDFGLARLPASPAGEHDALDAECAALTQQALGTHSYMSPEHFSLLADERSDVWSLGVVLYELLTLRRAFSAGTAEDARRLIETNAPTPPSKHIGNLPETLTAIFHKATRSRVADRYASARELAQDLRNWLDHKPTQARLPSLAEKGLLWARRNPGRAWASAMAAMMAIAAVFALLMASSADARLQSARANAATERATLAERGEKAQRREILMRDLVQLRLGTHTDGWTKKANALIAQIAPLGVDEELRTQAASCLMGMDAEHIAGFTDAPAWYVALSPDGRWMLTSGPRGAGVSPALNSEITLPIPTRLVEIATNQIAESRLSSPSLVTFLPDGTPVQIALPTAANPSFQLWDVRQQQSLGELAVPTDWTTDGLIAAVSRDGTHVAIAGQSGAGVSPAQESAAPPGGTPNPHLRRQPTRNHRPGLRRGHRPCPLR